MQDVLSLKCSILNQGTFAQIFSSVAGDTVADFRENKNVPQGQL